MATFAQIIGQTGDLSHADQVKAGQPMHGTLEDEHRDFLTKVIGLLDRQEIDIHVPESLLNREVYDALPDEWRAKTDLALPNIVIQLRHIAEYFHNPDAPNESPQMATMIEHLWQMKQRIEDTYDVFKL